MLKQNLNHIILCIWIILMWILINIVHIFIPVEIFNSPDEAANYQVVKEYGTTGKLFLKWDFLDKDYWNNLHSRGFITHEGKIVPFNFLWLPFVYGTFYTVFKDNIKYINILFLIIILSIIIKLSNLFYKNKNTGVVTLVFLWCLPIVYYLNFPYYNIVPLVPFFILSAYYLFKFNKTKNIKYLYLSAFFSLFVVWFRYNYIIFIFVFLLLNIIRERKTYACIKRKITHFFGVIILWCICFLIPLLLFNSELYWSPFTYWYSLFTKTFFDWVRTWDTLQSIINIFYQSHWLNLEILWINIKNKLFMISPLFFTLAYLFIFSKQWTKSIWIYWILIIYIIIYAWMADTYLSGSQKITIYWSTQRYWIVLYLGIILSVIWYINKKRINKISLLILIFLFLWTSQERLYDTLKKQIWIRVSYMNEIKEFQQNIQQDNWPNYLIVAKSDKYFFSDVNIISWWCWENCYKRINDGEVKLNNIIDEIISHWWNVYIHNSWILSNADVIDKIILGENIKIEYLSEKFLQVKAKYE